MGLERKVRFGGRSVLMGNGTKGAMYEDMIDADVDWKTPPKKSRHAGSSSTLRRREIGNPSPRFPRVFSAPQRVQERKAEVLSFAF